MSNIVDIRDHESSHSISTADKAAPCLESIELVWHKATLANEQVKLLHTLRDIGIGTNMVEKFMLDLEQDDIMSWGKLDVKWDRSTLDKDLLDCIMNIKIRGAERKLRKWRKLQGKEKKLMENKLGKNNRVWKKILQDLNRKSKHQADKLFKKNSEKT